MLKLDRAVCLLPPLTACIAVSCQIQLEESESYRGVFSNMDPYLRTKSSTNFSILLLESLGIQDQPFELMLGTGDFVNLW